MNTDNGEITQLTKEMLLANPTKEELEERLHQTKLNNEELAFMLRLAQEQRPKVLQDLRSKNHAAKRRAKKKIAKASRQRNR